MKLPFAKFYPGDHLSDEQLALCCAATQGVWSRLTAIMMKSGIGRIKAPVNKLAKMTGFSEAEIIAAIDELRVTVTADVAQDVTGLVTVTCRRLRRLEKANEQARLRMFRHRRKSRVTQDVTQDVTQPETDSLRGRSQKPDARNQKACFARAREGSLENFSKTFPKTEEEARAHAAAAKCSQDYAAVIWRECLQRNGTDRDGKPVRNFGKFLAGCEIQRAKWERAQLLKNENRKTDHRTVKPNPRNAGLAGDAAKRQSALVAAARRRAANRA